MCLHTCVTLYSLKSCDVKTYMYAPMCSDCMHRFGITYISIYACIRAYMHTYIHYIHIKRHSYCSYILPCHDEEQYAYVRTCVRAYIRTYKPRLSQMLFLRFAGLPNCRDSSYIDGRIHTHEHNLLQGGCFCVLYQLHATSCVPV